MLSIIKHHNVASLQYLIYLVLNYIYEPEKMKKENIRLMEESMVRWAQKLELDRSLEKLNDNEEYHIQRLALMLKKNAEGKFDARKKSFKDHKIDWRKVHRLPGAITIEGVVKAQRLYKDYAAKHKEQEAM
jgi:hypothetical protein